MLAGKTYSPILHTRQVEVRALEKLPEGTKDIIFPLLIARPWPNANHLNKTWEKIGEAFGLRRFALDLDPFKKESTSKKLAASEFKALFDPSEGYKAYYEQVRLIEQAIPVFQCSGGLIPDLNSQIAHINQIDRGAVLRLQHGLTQQPIEVARQVTAAFPEAAIVLDLGWSDDLLSRELWASGILNAMSQGQIEQEIVVAGSSFPQSFRKLARDERRADERVIFDNLVRRHNSVVLTYGDWGSTRLPTEPIRMGTIPARLDLPRGREWICFRQEGGENFQQIAARTLSDPTWPEDLNIWGTYRISATAEGMPDGIKNQTSAAAARVNIHLHQQAHFGAAETFSEQDEAFTDDL